MGKDREADTQYSGAYLGWNIMRYYDESLGIYYEILQKEAESTKKKYAVVTDADKKLNEIDIPCELNSCPVEKIGKKAFLGCKGLRRVSIPYSVSSVGEWAFAFCDNLVSVEMPRRRVEWGKGVFKNDNRLVSIVINDDFSASHLRNAEMISVLLAAVTVLMDAEYLLDTEHAGTEEWLGKWDTRLQHLLDLADDEGYHLYVLCGEEDLHFDYEEYLEYNREKKAHLCMLRLRNDVMLDNGLRMRLSDYLISHTAGCESDAAIRVLTEKFGDVQEYYSLMTDIGAINPDNFEKVLDVMGDRHAQMKAYLIEQCKPSSDDFYDNLAL